MNRCILFLLPLAAILIAGAAEAGPLRALFGGEDDDDGSSAAAEKLDIPGLTLKKDIAYGIDEKQRIDVYIPPHARHAPVLVMVHGGAWRFGDKTSRGVVGNKATHWMEEGFIFVSVNNRLLPKADPLAQADDVRSALAYVQKHAKSWGGDPQRIILMGHSAGAHLVALLTVDPDYAAAGGVTPWLGTVELDSAGMDITKLMSVKHFRFYDAAFTKDPAYWSKASPIDRLKKGAVPMLLICSTRHENSCDQAEAFVEKAHSLGVTAEMQQEDMSHMHINTELGEASPYTEVVDRFIKERLR